MTVYNLIDLDKELNKHPDVDVVWQQVPLASTFVSGAYGTCRIKTNKARLVTNENKYVNEHFLIPFAYYIIPGVFSKQYLLWTITTESEGKLWGVQGGHYTWVFQECQYKIPETYDDFKNILKLENNRGYVTEKNRKLESVFIDTFRTIWNKKRKEYRKENYELVKTLEEVKSTSSQILLMNKLRSFEAKLEFFKSKNKEQIYKEDFSELISSFRAFSESQVYFDNIKNMPNRPKPKRLRKSSKT